MKVEISADEEIRITGTPEELNELLEYAKYGSNCAVQLNGQSPAWDRSTWVGDNEEINIAGTRAEVNELLAYAKYGGDCAYQRNLRNLGGTGKVWIGDNAAASELYNKMLEEIQAYFNPASES